MRGAAAGGQRDRASGQESTFELQTFRPQVAEVMEAILPELDRRSNARAIA